jgi:hypothetical protein
MLVYGIDVIEHMMQVELRQLEQYLDQTLGAQVALVPWPDSARLAPFLQQLYTFWETRILGTPCLMMMDQGKQEQAAAVVRKHITQVQAKWPAEVVYVRGHLTPYNRRRLLEQKMPFIVPGNQMYLPMAGVAFRERCRRQIETPAKFSPATQVVLVRWLLKGTNKPLTPAEMAQQLGYSAMTTTRAFNELEAVRLGEVARRGKERRLRFVQAKPEVWAKAQPFLRSPVMRRVCIRQPHPAPDGIRAGLVALAHYSMLAAPEHPVMAVHSKDWKALPIWHNKAPIPHLDPEALEIEVWRYKPSLFAEHGVVDPLSLYLSLKNDEDERVQAGLEEMIGRIGW